MSRTDAYHGEPGGPIAFMASHRVAANLLMFGILAAGLVAFGALERQAWPTVPFNTIEVSVVYPGATPEEVEESIVQKIEEQVEALEDAKAVKSLAAPGIASVRVELKTGADMGEAMDEVKSAVGRIPSFPGAAERPQFREMDNRTSMIRLIVHGDIPERSLKELAHQIEDDLASLPNVSHVVTTGTRNYEISIEVPLARLRALGLTLDDVANAVRRSSLDLSAGSIDTRDGQVRVRTLGQGYDQFDFEEIVVIARNDGTVVRLGEIATVRDTFQNTDLILRHQGQPAVFVEIFRAEGEQVMDVADAVHEHTANVIAPSLPDGVGITTWNDDSQTYSERADILRKNGILGLLLVFIALALFLEIRLALWVVVGLVTSGIGALAVMLAVGLAINTISLFAFVLAIGIIVDDAIVVGEHIHYERMRGTPGGRRRDPGHPADQESVDLCRSHLGGGVRAAALHPRRHRRSLERVAGDRHRHAADLTGRSAADPAPAPLPPARTGMEADEHRGSVLRAHPGRRGCVAAQIRKRSPGPSRAFLDESTVRHDGGGCRPVRGQPIAGAGRDRPHELRPRRGG